jgi:uncharacterized membrane protein YoaK (UPF0700 family)
MARPAALAALLPPAGDRHGPLVPMMITLTVLTGVVDAASYLRLGHVFVANMTGNVVFVGFAIAGAHGLSLASSLIALGAFLLGARAGGEIGARLSAHRGLVVRGSVAVQCLLVAVALSIAIAAGAPPGEGARYAITAALAVAMGIQNAAAQRLAIPVLTTTVLTKTLLGLTFEDGGGGGGAVVMRARRLLSVLAMMIGALLGALLVLKVSVAAALGLALALCGATALAAHAVSRGKPAWASP